MNRIRYIKYDRCFLNLDQVTAARALPDNGRWFARFYTSDGYATAEGPFGTYEEAFEKVQAVLGVTK